MFRRSRAREVALQLLFQLDQNKKPMSAEAVRQFATDRLGGDVESVAFCVALFNGVAAHREAIDATITATAENWRLHRMMPSDRNVLRLGTHELLHTPTPEPTPVILNEAVELAKRFGTADSPSFVNGVLDKIAQNRKPDDGVKEEKPIPETTAPIPPSSEA